jgi:predicted hydrocarbon binding protein
MARHHRWIKKVIEVMSVELDDETRRRILEECGRDCLLPRVIIKLKEVWEETEYIDEWIEKIQTDEIWEAIVLEDGVVYVLYPECYCPILKDAPKYLKIPDTYCECSVGWLKELFEGVFERDVEIELISSIVRGDKECKFKVEL